jgi:rhodanese-related sulfurtransferase
VQGARHLGTITSLNRDLVQRNEELTRTVTELTEARHTITLLERAGERMRSFLHAEGLRSRRFSWLDCGVILLASMLLGFLFNLASPNGVPLVPEHLRRPPAQTVTAAQAQELVQGEGALLVDARPQAFYDQKHIAGAVNLTPALFDMGYLMRFAQLPLSTPIIVYGGNISRRWDEDVAARLSAREHERVFVLEEGLAGWIRQGLAVEP